MDSVRGDDGYVMTVLLYIDEVVPGNPTRHGGHPDKQWFSSKFVGDHGLRAFASEQLSLMPILNCFLTDTLSIE